MRTIFFLPLFLTLCAAAQEKQVVVQKPAGQDSRWAVTFSPLALVQIDYTVLSGAEYTLNNRWHAVADAGYIFSSSYINQGDAVRQASGFLLRPGLKYFTTQRKDFYLQPQLFYKQVTHSMYDWLDKEVDNGGVAAYQQLKDFRYRRKVFGFNATVGTVHRLGNNPRLLVDWYLGFGVRKKAFDLVNEKASRYNRINRGLLNLDEEGKWYPSLPVGIRFLYKF